MLSSKSLLENENNNMDNNSNSLKTLTIRYVVKHLTSFDDEYSLDIVRTLPIHIKNQILKILLSYSSFFTSETTVHKFFDALTNDRTTHINLSFFNVNDNLLSAITRCSGLRKLHINGLSAVGITPFGLAGALSNKPNLQFLSILNCNEVDDEIVRHIVTESPNLRGLDLGGCHDVGDGALDALRSSGVECLRLSYSQISDLGITMFVMGNCAKQLTELRIDNCRNVTEVGLRLLCNFCVKLTNINFSNCSTGTDGADLADCLTNLHFNSRPKQLFWQIIW